MNNKKSKNIIITGASSGIGKALAIEFAKRGHNIGITSRRFESLRSVRQEIRSIVGDTIKIELSVLDVRSYSDVFKTLKELSNSLGGMDVLVVNSGIAGAKPAGTGGFQENKNIIETNLIGAIATIEAGAEILISSGREGQIVGISSIAGLRGFPGNGTYCASKAGFTVFLEAAREELRNKGILITTILPGFIDTPINEKMKNRPFVVSAEKGAKDIANIIESKKEYSTVPVFPWRPLSWILRLIPDFIWRRVKFE